MHHNHSMKQNKFKCGLLLSTAILMAPNLLAGTGENTTQNAKPWPFRSLVLGDVGEMYASDSTGDYCLKTEEVDADLRPTVINPTFGYPLYTYDFSFDKQGNLLDKASGNKTAWRGVLFPTENNHISQVVLQNKNCPSNKILFRFPNFPQGYYFNSQTLRMCNFASSTLPREKKISASGFNSCFDWPKHLRDKQKKFINTSRTASEEATLYLGKYAGYFRFNDPVKPVVGLDQSDLTDVWHCFANCPSGKPGKFDPN